MSRPPSWWVGVGALASWLSSFDGVGLGLGVACCRGLGQYALVALLSGLTRCLLVLLLAGVWVWVVWVGWL